MKMFIARFLLVAIFLPLFLTSSLKAQTVTANSCSVTDVTNAWASVTSSTTLFRIPAGTCDWSAGVHLTAPAGSTSLTIQGAGTTTGADSLGNPTGYNDQTTTQINTQTAGIVGFNSSTSQTLLRITGITFQFLQSTSSCSVTFGGGWASAMPTPFLRVDHTHWWTTQNGVCLAETYGAIWGVVDHNVTAVPVSNSSFQGVSNFWRVGASYTGDGFAAGAFVWNKPTAFGTGQFLYFEDNFITGGYMNDCSSGGKQVFRYNTISHSIEQGHEGTGDFRGCRATEFYGNKVTCDSFNGGVTSTRSGTMLVWGNTTVGCSSQLIGLNEDRTNGHGFGAPPDWGYCGTGGVIAGPSPWDGNSLGLNNASGYPCVDQPGRGEGDYIWGSAFGFGEPMRANVTRKICPVASTVVNGQAVTCPSGYTIGNDNPGQGSWPHNALEPVYEWMDSAQGQVGGDCGNLSDCIPNRDFYQEAIGQGVNSCSGGPGVSCTPFSGATGTGHGTFANRPNNCTAGPGGLYGTAPPLIGGSLGVAYWATDKNTLYVCNATNTWVTFYTPYTYPHPLISGGGGGGAVTISPSTENFGSVNVGDASSGQIATVSNTSGATITISSLANSGGNTGDFSTVASGSNPCSGTVANNASCTVTTTFTPPATGSRSTTLQVSFTGTPGSPLTVVLSGTGTVPVTNPPSCTPTSGLVPQTVTCTNSNSGTAVMCYAISPTTPATNGAGTGCNTGSVYTTPLTISSAETLEVITGVAGRADSFISQYTYTASNNCPSPTSVGQYTFCSEAYNDVNGASVSVSMSPFAGNGVELFVSFCSASGCSTPPAAVTLTVSDNVNNPETCFTRSPHSPFSLANTSVPDYETLYALYCPSIPSGVSTFTASMSSAVDSLQLDAIEWKVGSIASANYFENVDNITTSDGTANTVATVVTSGSTVNPNDLVTSLVATCGLISATVGSGYTGIIVNPSGTPGHIVEAEAVTAIQSPNASATTTWSSGTALGNCGLGQSAPNDTWFGVIVPLVGGAVTITPASLAFGSVTVGVTSPGRMTTVSNHTASAITVGTINYTGTNPLDFATSATTCSGTVAASGGSCTITTTFKPGGAGSRLATLNFNYSGGSSGDATVALSGVGGAPQVGSCAETQTTTPNVATNVGRHAGVAENNSTSDATLANRPGTVGAICHAIP